MGKKKLKVVLDTNVILSSLLFGGRLAFIHEAWKERSIILLFSEDTLKELVKVLHYPKFGLEDEEIDFLIYSEVVPYTKLVKETVKVDKEICIDEDDVKFLECAVSDRADYIISGDEDLICVGEIEGIKIITPAELRKLLVVG